MPELNPTGALEPLAGYRSVGLAVSGGADSLALMVLVHDWLAGRRTGPSVNVYSVDHGLRPEARDEARFVVSAAKRLGFAARALTWEGPKPESGVEARARAARYRLIAGAMAEDSAQVLVTAHHMDDQAETVLMRLAHGSGIEGLGGMRTWAEQAGLVIFRPLLGMNRDQLRAIVARAGLVPVLDPGNSDPYYERVRWRQALPGLGAFGLNARGLARLAQRAQDADDALALAGDRAFDDLVAFEKFGALNLDRMAFADLPRAVGVKLLSRLVAVAGGGDRPRALGVLERLHDSLSRRSGFSGASALGCRFSRRDDRLWVWREPGRRPLPNSHLGPGGSLLWDGRFAVANLSLKHAVAIGPAAAWSRSAVERAIGVKLDAPAEIIRAAPVVTGGDGTVLALGSYELDKTVRVGLAGAARG